MSEITGSIGSDSVRLRGMALEETQRQILAAIRKTGDSKGFFGGFKSEAESAGVGLGKFGSIIGIVTKAGGALLESLKAVTGGLSSLEDQIRASDSSIRQSSTNLRILAANTAMMDSTVAKATSKIYKFAAEGISQLEEQYDVYKKLSNIGGVVAGDFDTLRITASNLGVNMQEYAQLMQENFMNLRLGGRSARSAMLGVKDIAIAMRDSGEEYNNQFMRLGIGVNDYGKVILENSMLLGGLSQAQAGTNKEYINRMLATTKSVTQLGDAFGFNREIVMKAANEALQDARNRTIYNNIREAGKEQMLSLMTGLFGGDAQKGMRAVIAAYTGRFDEQTAVLAGIAPDLIDKLKALSKEVAGGTSVMEAIKKVDLQPTFNRLKASSYDMAQTALDNSGSYGVAANAVINFTDLFGDLTKVQERLKESTESVIGKNSDNLDALGRFQRENVRMTVAMAVANKTLNNFGLSLALGTQIITSVMSNMAKEIALQGDKPVNEFVKTMASINKTSIDAINRYSDLAGENIEEVMGKVFDGLVEQGIMSRETANIIKETTQKTRAAANTNAQPATTNSPQPATTNSPQPATTNSPQPATTTRATLGPAASMLLGQIERSQNARARLPADQQRDEPLKITYSVDKGEDSSKQVDEIRRLMDQANLKQGVDYKLDSNYDSQQGKIDVRFLSQDAATKFAAAANKMRVQPSAPPVSAPPPNASSVSQTGAVNIQPSQTAVSQVSATTESRTDTTQNPSQVNNTAITTALLDQNNKWLEKFEKIHNDDTTRVMNKLESLTQEMRRLA